VEKYEGESFYFKRVSVVKLDVVERRTDGEMKMDERRLC